MADTPGTHNPLRYRGYVYDIETGLYYVSSRYYDPEVGRFINADVLVSTGQGLLGNNMFSYCRNNPVRRVDVTGTADVDYLDETDDVGLDHEEAGRPNGGDNSFDSQQAILDGNFAGGYSYGGSNYNLLPSWLSTGRSQPSNLNEQIAMKAARTNPQSGKVIKETLKDPRLAGYAKYARHYSTSKGGIEVHYVGNPETNTFDDFKFK